MAECCTEPVIIHRQNPDTGRPEQSTDGGEVWTPDPSDVQNQVMVLPPIVSEGGRTKCDAATNASEHVNELIDATRTNLETAGTVFELAVAIAGAALALFLIFITAGALTAPVTAVATAIWAAATAAFELGVEAYDTYWTTDKKDEILCALFCTIGDNGQFDDSQYANFVHRIRDRLPDSPFRALIMNAINAGGSRGLSQMASYGNAADADCASCHCDDTWCKTWDFTEASFDSLWSSYNPSSNPAVYNTSWVTDTGWQTANGSPNYSIIKIAINTHILTRVTFVLDPLTDATAFMGILPSATADATVNYAISDRNFDGSEPTGTYLAIGQRDRAILTSVTLHGTGVNPFGADNCA